jgi:HAD superfamily hydrolase (TIGR01509 family)
MRQRRSSRTGEARRTRQQPAGIPWSEISNIVFDVEGTLVDAVMPTLQCWRQTLQEFGHTVALAELHPLSGMDGKDMLKRLLPAIGAREREHFIERQGHHYREDYLPRVRPLPDVARLFEELKQRACRIGLATDYQRDELDHYLAITHIAPFLDAIACGSQVKRGKPHPDLLGLALRLLRANAAATVMVGDTPYDAQAARRLDIWAVGMLSGHFAGPTLRAAGCWEIVRDVAALRKCSQSPSSPHEPVAAKAS